MLWRSPKACQLWTDEQASETGAAVGSASSWTRAVSDGLREQSADAARRLASAAPAFVLEYATAVNAVYEDCRAAYGDMAAKAAGHAADVQSFGAAWLVISKDLNRV